MSDVRYTFPAIILHWLIAAMVLGLLPLGLYMTSLGNDTLSLKFTLYQWHKSIGITVLLLAIIRLIWRITHRPPSLPSAMPVWERRTAHGMHYALYALTLATPIAGWAVVSASPLGIPTELYGLIAWPHLPLQGKAAETAAKWAHFVLALTLAVLAVGHAGAAFCHQFLLKDGLMARMLWRKGQSA